MQPKIISNRALDDFETHTAIVIRTLPESGFVIIQIQSTIFTTAPVPLAIFIVYKVLLNICPTVLCFLQSRLVTEILIDIKETYHCFSLYPPMEVAIHIASVEISFMNHRTIGIKSFLRSFRHHFNDGLH